MRQQAAAPLNADLTAADIVAQCSKWIPVNARIDAAIEAHRIAFGRYFRDGKVLDEQSRAASMYALRAVTFARTPAPDDYKAMLEYLSGLPIEAWEPWEGKSAELVREEHLRAITRGLIWIAQA